MTDHLERLFEALVRRVRDVRPEHLSRPFEVAEILRTFVPYRATRAEVGVETAEDYEVLVLRLLSGERGFVFADDAMQDDLRRELDSGNPDLRALHAYGTAKVTLAQHAMRQVLESSPAAVAAAAPVDAGAPTEHAAPSVPRDTDGRVVAAVERAPGPPPIERTHDAGDAPASHAPASHAPATRAPTQSEVKAALDTLQRQLPPTLAELNEAMGAAGEGRTRGSFQPHSPRIPDPTAESSGRAPRPGCRFCGQMLPEGREVTFCPHCGQNLKVRRCPGCSAEIEPAWKFCVTCGRATGASG